MLAVSNGVIKSSKANFGVTKSLDYEIALAADGKATATLRLGYKKSPRLLKGAFQQWLANYTRVHRADGTTMIPGTSPGSESLPDATGMPTFAHYFRLIPGSPRASRCTSTFRVLCVRGWSPIRRLESPNPTTPEVGITGC